MVQMIDPKSIATKAAQPPQVTKSTEELKQEAMTKIREAAKACYEWFGSCEVGPERERAADIYETVLNAPRNR